MMPRYANVDKLMKHAVNLEWSVLKWVNEVDICTAINPNVVERKRGKWMSNDTDGFMCSVCRNICRQPVLMGTPMFYFCPICGADMREESEDGDQ